MALSSGDFLASVVAPRPPFSVVLTDWLSMMAALGVASRPSLSRTMGRSASSTRSQVPLARQFPEIPPGLCPKGAGHGASIAKVCRHAGRTECRPPPPAGPRSEGALWLNPGATRAPAGPIGGRSNQWDTLFAPYPQLTRRSTNDAKLLPRGFRPLSHTLLGYPLARRTGRPPRRRWHRPRGKAVRPAVRPSPSQGQGTAQLHRPGLQDHAGTRRQRLPAVLQLPSGGGQCPPK